MTAKEYTKLNKYESYDKEAAEELAEAIMELKLVTERAVHLKELIDENKELQPFVWTTAEGVTKALHNIDDEHLTNIMNWLVDNGRAISKSIKAEARKRKLTVPAETGTLLSRARALEARAYYDQVDAEEIDSIFRD